MKRLLIIALGLLAALAPAPAAAQDEIETESITEQGTLDPFSADADELRPIFDEAERLFRTAEQPDSVALFDRLIARLESDHAREPLTGDLLAMLIQSRSHRAEARFNLGLSDEVTEDFERILQIEPGWRIDREMVSPKLVDVFERLRRRTIGQLLVRVEPPDATVTVGERQSVMVGQPIDVLAGTLRLVITRPGYAPVDEAVEIAAARTATVEHLLERTSMVALVRVRPAGATVLVNGQPAQIAGREALADEPGEELAIDGLAPGRHILEFRLAGHRPYRSGFEALDLGDYRMKPVALTLMQGEVRLSGLPEDATVKFNGAPHEASATDEGGASFLLAPGDYLVEVDQPGLGGFRRQLSLGDQEVASLAVELQPAVAFLGVLGADRLAASDLSARLSASLGGLPDWLWQDHSISAAAVLDAAGLSAAEMRRVGRLASRRAAPDWAEIRESLDDRFGASLYLLAVLADDLYATHADLWLWSAPPWPADPGIRTVPIEAGSGALEALVASLQTRPIPTRVQFGARWLEAEGLGLVVGSVLPGGAAQAAGLVPGDRILDLDGEPVTTLEELRARGRRAIGREALLRIHSEPAPTEARLRVHETFGVLSLSDPSPLDQAVAARLAIQLRRPPGDVPHWLLELNRAAIYLRAMDYRSAVPLLRAIEAPAGPGLGQAMVDYWLASALLSLDRGSYAEAARAALERALEQPGARLYHADGPLLAPRARARLTALERALGN